MSYSIYIFIIKHYLGEFRMIMQFLCQEKLGVGNNVPKDYVFPVDKISYNVSCNYVIDFERGSRNSILVVTKDFDEIGNR